MTPVRLVGLLGALLLVGLVWWGQGDPVGPETARDPGSAQDASASREPTAGGAATDPASGLPWIAEASLPEQARRTLALIDAGGPWPYDEDDEVFGNRERLLPQAPRGYYREYTVETPGLGHRGARRIVAGDDGERYWTRDHYASFSRVRLEGG